MEFSLGEKGCQHAGGISGADLGHRRAKGSFHHQLAWLGFGTLQVLSLSDSDPAWRSAAQEWGQGALAPQS